MTSRGAAQTAKAQLSELNHKLANQAAVVEETNANVQRLNQRLADWDRIQARAAVTDLLEEQVKLSARKQADVEVALSVKVIHSTRTGIQGA